MRHFIIDFHYTVPAEQLGETTAEHRAFLQAGYQQGLLLFSGLKVPGNGGMIVARAESTEELAEFFKNDPYQKKGMATYEYIEFDPVSNQGFLEEWVSGKGEAAGFSPGQEFMKMTRYQYQAPSQQSQGLPQPPLELSPAESGKTIDLPAPDTIQISPIDLRQAIEHRRSRRHYTDLPLTMEELSFLLWLTQGVKEVTNRPATQRTVPSAGARHAFETYLAVNRVEGLPAGLYHFLAIEHRLQELPSGPDFINRLMEACRQQQHVVDSAVTFVWVAVRERMYWRYGERGYRFLHLDAGHVCQNLYLAAEALHCGVCAIGAYDDDNINQLLGLDGVDQFVIYGATLGKRG